MSNDTQIAAIMGMVESYAFANKQRRSDDFLNEKYMGIEKAIRAAVEASARQLAEQPGHLLIAAERWAQLEHMWSRNATPETIASYIGRPEILDRISKIRREHEAAVQGNAA